MEQAFSNQAFLVVVVFFFVFLNCTLDAGLDFT